MEEHRQWRSSCTRPRCSTKHARRHAFVPRAQSTQNGESIDDATRVWLKMGAKDVEKTGIEKLGSLGSSLIMTNPIDSHLFPATHMPASPPPHQPPKNENALVDPFHSEAEVRMGQKAAEAYQGGRCYEGGGEQLLPKWSGSAAAAKSSSVFSLLYLQIF